MPTRTPTVLPTRTDSEKGQPTDCVCAAMCMLFEAEGFWGGTRRNVWTLNDPDPTFGCCVCSAVQFTPPVQFSAALFSMFYTDLDIFVHLKHEQSHIAKSVATVSRTSKYLGYLVGFARTPGLLDSPQYPLLHHMRFVHVPSRPHPHWLIRPSHRGAFSRDGQR